MFLTNFEYLRGEIRILDTNFELEQQNVNDRGSCKTKFKFERLYNGLERF